MSFKTIRKLVSEKMRMHSSYEATMVDFWPLNVHISLSTSMHTHAIISVADEIRISRALSGMDPDCEVPSINPLGTLDGLACM